MAKYFKWNIDKIIIYPYGGCVKFSEKINKSLKEELFIMIAGPLVQVLFYLVAFILFKNNIISYRNFDIIKQINYTLLAFNLLPIYPLDGGKLLNIILNFLLPYKKGNIITVIISITFLVVLMAFTHNVNYTFMIALLFTEIIVYLKRQDYLFNRLLLERYLYNYNFKKFKIINNKNNIYQGKRHIIKYHNSYITERSYLNKRYKGSA